MSTPLTWSPQPPDDRRTPPPESPHDQVWSSSTTPAVPAEAPVDPFRAPEATSPYAAPQYAAPQYAAPPYAAPQYAAPQYAAPQYAAPQYATAQPSTDPYGAPAPGFNPGAPTYPYNYAYGPGNSSAAQGTSGLAIASLVTSLVGFLLPITAPVGLVLGIVALGKINRDGNQGRGLAIAGIAVGGVMTLAFVFGIIAFVGLIAAFPASGGFAT
ncbi:MAG: DUF4190 domain-containing protein [Cellulomonas sp.]